MSTLSPESSFSLSRGPILRLGVAFNPLCCSKTGGCLKSGSERDYLHRNHRVLVFPPPQSLYLCWSLSLFPLCSTEFTVKTQEAEWFPLRKVPDREVKEQSHQQVLWAIPPHAVTDVSGAAALERDTLQMVFARSGRLAQENWLFSCGNPKKGSPEFVSSSWWFVNNSRYLFIY